VITSKSFIHDSSRQHLYFGQYKYRCCVAIDGMNYFKNTHSSYDVDIRANSLIHEPFFSWRKPFRTDTVVYIKRFVSWRNRVANHSSTHKLVITQNTVNIYTNDVDLIETFRVEFEDTVISETMKLTFSKIRTDYEKDKIYRANPRHQYRVYLKSKRVTQQEKNELREFFSESEVSMSAALERWLEQGLYSRNQSGGYWCWDYLFFDYDDEYIPTLMALKFDGMIRKICRIIKK
jgi:hypothetical protein